MNTIAWLIGTRPGFRTDTSISNNRPGSERILQKWQPDASGATDLSLESSSSGAWDQFAENERRFGIKSDYDETMYTTAIDTSHPQYKQRLAEADRKAREIQSTAAFNSHVAEERVMDYAGGNDKAGDEEEKYSGVRREQEGGTNVNSTTSAQKYMPPARRAPMAQPSSHGVPSDPAIISSVVKGQGKKPTPTKQETKMPDIATPSTSASGSMSVSRSKSPVPEAKVTEPGISETMSSETTKSTEKNAIPLRPSPGSATSKATQPKDGATPSATSTVERDVLNSFKSFAASQRMKAQQERQHKAKQDKEIKLIELKKFAEGFKLSTPVPNDLIGIIAKDPAKQKEIQAKALKNAEEVAQAKKEPSTKDKDKDSMVAAASLAPKDQPLAKPTSGEQTLSGQNESRTGPSSRPPVAPTTTSTSAPGRHPNSRPSFNPGYHNFRSNQSPSHNMSSTPRTGNLGPRLRNIEQGNKNNAQINTPPGSHHSGHMSMQDMRPPTGPAIPSMDQFGNGSRRLSGAAGGKLNPATSEFRPGGANVAYVSGQFHLEGTRASAGSSPRSSLNNLGDPSAMMPSMPILRGQLIRKKTQSVNLEKCRVLAQIKLAKPPPPKNWDENGGLRPAYDTLPTWRSIQDIDQESPDSTMRLTYTQHFEKQPFAPPSSLATPNPHHVMPLPHQHQLPFHLQHMPPRQSPHMPPMQMHAPHAHGHGGQFNNGGVDDHRMVPTSSSQSFQSPRMSQVPMAGYAQGMQSPAQVPYQQPGMHYMGPGAPQMANQYRNFNPGQPYLPQQSHMGPPMMMGQPFPGGPQIPQMPMYPGGHPSQFMPPGNTATQPMPGSNGYPSPGRPQAPMMAPQGSQQGQSTMYSMSPGMQYQQPNFPPQQPGQGSKFPKNGPSGQMRKY